LDNLPRNVRWQESEYYTEGKGELPIEGCQARIVDKGMISDIRTYQITDPEIETVTTLCKFSRLADIGSGEDEALCPDMPALKLMMLSIIYEEANETIKSTEYESLAMKKLEEAEDAYRGIAREIFTASQYVLVPRKSRTNIR